MYIANPTCDRVFQADLRLVEGCAILNGGHNQAFPAGVKNQDSDQSPGKNTLNLAGPHQQKTRKWREVPNLKATQSYCTSREVRGQQVFMALHLLSSFETVGG